MDLNNVQLLPELGSRQSAVMAFTNMMAAALGENEDKLIFWLDAYYQLRALYENEREPRPEAPAEPTTEQEPPIESVAPAAEPAELLQNIEDDVELKRRVRDRMLELREAGWTGAMMQKASHGEVNLTSVFEMINAKQVSMNQWRKMAKALDKIDIQEVKADGK